jgi:hypothetical protein
LGRLAQAATAAAIVGAVSAFGCSETTTHTPTPTIKVVDNPPEPPQYIEPTPPLVTPIIEVRDDPPEVPWPTVTVSAAIVGKWTASQAYDIQGERVWLDGTLAISGSFYTFDPPQVPEGPSVGGMLDFLYEIPEGDVTIEYADGVTPGDSFHTYGPDDVLAACTFYADSEVAGEFLIKVGDSNDLYLHSTSDKGTLWQVTRAVKGY